MEEFSAGHFVYNHRPGRQEAYHHPAPDALKPVICRELGLAYRIRARPGGKDPQLFLDFRAARRWVRGHASGSSVLNLFACTCGVGLSALAGGASLVWNVDFSRNHLELGRQNLLLNGLPEKRFRNLAEDVYPVLWQLARQPVKGRAAHRRRYVRLEPRQFDLVVIDPPPFSKGPFGAVDAVRDYQSLFKPCLRIVAPGGAILAANNAPGQDLEGFRKALERCADRAGRPAVRQRVVPPDPDFPSWDGRPPLKVVVCWF